MKRGWCWVLGALWFTQVGVAAPGGAADQPRPSATPGGGGGGLIVPVLPANPDGLDAVPDARDRAGGGGGTADRPDGQDEDRQRQDAEDDRTFNEGPQRGAAVDPSPTPPRGTPSPSRR